MNIKCYMLLAFLLAGCALPSDSHRIRLRNLMKRSPSPRPSPVQRPVPSPSPVPPSLRQVAPLSPPLPPRPIPPSPRSIPASSVTTPTPSKKVEQFAKKLREDMDKQERVLNVFITTIKQKHEQSKLKLSRVKVILKGLKDEIANATKYANQFQAEDNDQSKQAKIIQDEYLRSAKMFRDEQENIEFEKKFLEEIIKYIQLRKSNCLTK